MATTKELITQLYIGYFNRAPDPEGLAYWIEDVDVRGQSIEAVSGLFTTSPEAIALYPYLAFPTLTSPDAFLTALYQNLFNRAIDPDGLAYYKAKLEAGVATGDVLADILANARTNEGSEDQALLANKTEVGVYWAEQAASTPGFSYNDAAQSSARNSLTNVTTDEASVEAAKKDSDSFFETVDPNAGQTYTFTTVTDSFVGGAGNDTFIGVADGVTSTNVGAGQPVTQTFGGLDTVDGGAGIDTIKITNEVGTLTLATSVTVKNVEKLELTSAQNAVTADVQAWTGLESVTVDNKSTTAAHNAVITTKANVTSVSIKGGRAANNVAATIIDNGTGTGTGKDTLASVTLEKVAGAQDTVGIGAVTNAATRVDSLTSLTLIDNASSVTVNSNAGTRELTLTLNKVTDGTITDAEATSLKVVGTGEKSSGVDLVVAKAKTIDFSGDKEVSLDIGTAANQAANLVITSTNTAGVKLAAGNALDTDVTFTGGEGKDSVKVAATTKTIDLGAGDDTVEVTAALGATGKLVGGEGTDTLVLSAALAETLTANGTFAGKVEGFEKVSIGQVAADETETVNLANLDNIDYVVSAGTLGNPSATETNTVTFAALTAFQSVTVGGLTVKADATGLTTTQLATIFATGTVTNGATKTGTLTGWTAAAAVSGVGSNELVFTSATPNASVVNISVSGAGVAASALPTIANNTIDGNDLDAHETFDILFRPLLAGQRVTFDGRTLQALVDLTADEVAGQYRSATPDLTKVAFTGVHATNWNITGPTGNSVHFVAQDFADHNPAALLSADPGIGAAGNPGVAETTAGSAGTALVVNNLANNGTFELTGVIAGEVKLVLKDATGSADVLNIKLNGADEIVNTGKLTAAGVETVNIEATDSSSDTTALNNPDAASTINLVAADATKIVLTGNHGVNFTGSTLTNVVELDASGVVSVGDVAGANAAQIGTTGAVTFTSAVTNKDVIVKTGNGADVINLASVTDATKGATVTTGEGNDIVTGTAGKDTIDLGAGNDIVNSTAGADTITLGAGNDKYVLTDAAHSVLASFDTLVDFSANTKGQGPAVADVAKGAVTVAADLTGDLIDLTGRFSGAVDGIKVLVVGNSADAQTFIQNTANVGAGAEANFTGIALDTSSNQLYLDLNQDGSVDSVIKLTGVTTITEAAFLTGL